jgi:hypothetical protein
VIWQNEPIYAPDKHPKIFSILVSNLPRYLTFRTFHIFSLFVQIRSAYSKYMNRFSLCILSIKTDSFCIFSVYELQNFFRRFTSFHVFSVYVQILFVYSQCTNRFILRILSICTDSLRILGEWALIILYIQNIIIFFTAFKGILLQKIYVCVQLDWRPIRNNRLSGPSLLTNFFPCILIVREMIRIWYLGEFKFIFEKNLRSESGDQELAFDKKKQMWKISCKCTFMSENLNLNFSLK